MNSTARQTRHWHQFTEPEAADRCGQQLGKQASRCRLRYTTQVHRLAPCSFASGPAAPATSARGMAACASHMNPEDTVATSPVVVAMRSHLPAARAPGWLGSATHHSHSISTQAGPWRATLLHPMCWHQPQRM